MHNLLLLVLLAVSTTAQAWQPTQPVQIIVANPAGGSSDAIARIIAEGMESRTSHRYMVVNRPGAQGVIGARAVMAAPADGHTLLLTGTTYLYAHLLRVPNADYDPVRDLSHVGLIGTVPTKLYSRRDIAGDITTILSQVRQGRDFSWAVTFAGAEFAARMMARATGKDINIVKYNGATQAYTDIIGGHVDFMFDTGSGGAIQDAVKTGRVRLLATLDRRDNVPDSLDAIIPGLINIGWFGLSLPPATAPNIVQSYVSALNVQLSDPAIRAKLSQIMVQPSRSTNPAHFVRTIQDDLRHFQPIATAIR